MDLGDLERPLTDHGQTGLRTEVNRVTRTAGGLAGGRALALAPQPSCLLCLHPLELLGLS